MLRALSYFGGSLLLLILAAVGGRLVSVSGAPDDLLRLGIVDTIMVRRPCGDSTCRVPRERRQEIEVRYPRRVRVDESRALSVSYTLEADSVWRQLWRDSLARPRDVTLAGANFVIAPKETQAVTMGPEGRVEALWSVLPKSAGNHSMVLNVAALYGQRAVEVALLDMDGKATGRIAASQVEIPVTVATEWGIGRQAMTIIRGAFAVVAFLLSYVGFGELKKWLGRRESPPSATQPPAPPRARPSSRPRR